MSFASFWFSDHFTFFRQMPESTPTQLTIEHTPSYFVAPWVPERIYRFKPGIKLILILTDPARRVHSDYLHTRDILPQSYKAHHTFTELIFNKGTETLNTSYEPLTTGELCHTKTGLI